MKPNKPIKPIIIAEACQNHKGDLKILEDMIYQAADAGADYIKIQSMLADELTYRPRFEEGLVENGETKAIKRPYQPEYQRLKPMDVDDQGHAWFVETCRKASINPLTTLFTPSRISMLVETGFKEIKVASYDCASFPLLQQLKENFDRLFISTGATHDEEIQEAADLLGDAQFMFLHCVTIYPTPLNEVHLKRMEWLKQFSQYVGFSDHSLVERDGIKASLAALYMGASVIERHFTILDPKLTKDGPVSITPAHIKELAHFAALAPDDQKNYIEEKVPELPIMMGQAQRPLSHLELLNRDYYRGRFAINLGDHKYRYNWEQ